MEWYFGVLIIFAAAVVAALFYKFDNGQSILDKLFRGLFLLMCLAAVLFGFIIIIVDATSDIGDSRDSYYESSEDYDDDEVNETNLSFRGREVIADYDYGRCNNGCGCTQYAHYPGQTACVNCEENGCSTNKFGHKH
jgi:hypothetical protein